MARIKPELKEHVGALVAQVAGANESTFVGTCFFVWVTNRSGLVFDYLITARHVLEAMQKAGGPAALRVNRGKVGTFNQGTIDVPLKTDGWILPKNKHVDIAALRFSFGGLAVGDASGEIFRFLRLNLDRLTDTRPAEMQWPPLEGEDVLFISMTSQFQGKSANLPTVRKGSIALVTDEPLNGQYGPDRYYVIEGQVYPGNSGSPVWAFYRGDALVSLGVLAYSYPTQEEIRRTQQDGTSIYYNFGLSLVVPIERVMELIHADEETAWREEFEGPVLPGEALSALDSSDSAILTQEMFQDALRQVSGRVKPSEPDSRGSGT